MKKLNEDFKSGKFEQVYLLYGEEGYLKKQYKGDDPGGRYDELCPL